jgi:hypothetical protein
VIAHRGRMTMMTKPCLTPRRRRYIAVMAVAVNTHQIPPSRSSELSLAANPAAASAGGPHALVVAWHTHQE